MTKVDTLLEKLAGSLQESFKMPGTDNSRRSGKQILKGVQEYSFISKDIFRSEKYLVARKWTK